MFPGTWGGPEKFSTGLLYGGFLKNYDLRLPSALKFVAWAPKKAGRKGGGGGGIFIHRGNFCKEIV